MIAAGGKAAPKFGTTGDGARLAAGLGHTVTRLAPALTGVITEEDIAAFSGIRARAEIGLAFRGENIFRERGEVQFTDYGLSGICVFNMSRHLEIPPGKSLRDGFAEYSITLDLLPEVSDVESILRERWEHPGFEGPKIMRSMVRLPIAERIWEMAEGDVRCCGQLLKAFPLHVKSVRGWQYAQITRGGVSYAEIEPETMESRLVSGLYFGGEVLDYDGRCGGFNLQHAFETGIRAGKGMIR
jgi:predicted Rossmann fold flavoprotein